MFIFQEIDSYGFNQIRLWRKGGRRWKWAVSVRWSSRFHRGTIFFWLIFKVARCVVLHSIGSQLILFSFVWLLDEHKCPFIYTIQIGLYEWIIIIIQLLLDYYLTLLIISHYSSHGSMTIWLKYRISITNVFYISLRELFQQLFHYFMITTVYC